MQISPTDLSHAEKSQYFLGRIFWALANRIGSLREICFHIFYMDLDKSKAEFKRMEAVVLENENTIDAYNTEIDTYNKAIDTYNTAVKKFNEIVSKKYHVDAIKRDHKGTSTTASDKKGEEPAPQPSVQMSKLTQPELKLQEPQTYTYFVMDQVQKYNLGVNLTAKSEKNETFISHWVNEEEPSKDTLDQLDEETVRHIPNLKSKLALPQPQANQQLSENQ